MTPNCYDYKGLGGSNMNKQYKVIWSKVRHCYVVVSELAKRSPVKNWQ